MACCSGTRKRACVGRQGKGGGIKIREDPCDKRLGMGERSVELLAEEENKLWSA
jgi:hypothetical protein